jgi:hypothetical protein
MASYRGRCHCGELQLQLESKLSPEELPHRACSCDFCTRQGARYVSDPAGSLSIESRSAAGPSRYRFATGTADFLFCGRCGVYVGAVCEIEGARYAVINANTLENRLPTEAARKNCEGETEAERTARRARTWTPVRC